MSTAVQPNDITLDEIVRYYSNQSDYRNYRCFSPWAKVGVSAAQIG